MGYTEESFASFYDRMPLFQKIAAQNGYALKDLLLKKVGVEEELANALIAAWNDEQQTKKDLLPAAGIADKRFDAYLREMASFQRLAGLQGIDLTSWLKTNCAVDAATAEALIKAAGVQAPPKNEPLLAVLARPADEPQQAAAAATGPRALRGARTGQTPDDDVIITISGAPDAGDCQPFRAPETPDADAQIEHLHAIADNPKHTEPLQLILELQEIGLRKGYLKNPVTSDELERAERLLRDREEQKKKLLRLEKRLEETRAAETALKNKPPKLFRREEYRLKLQKLQEDLPRIEQQLAATTAKEAERQTDYLAAVSCTERHAAAKREMDRQYRLDEQKLKEAKDVIIRALHWAQLDIPADILTGSVMDRLSWYESFFKTFPETFDLPLHGWIKAYAIVSKLACDFPHWHGKIENIHFVVDSEMKSLKEAIRLFLDGFVANVGEPFSAVCQLRVLKSEAGKTRGGTMAGLVTQREQEMRGRFDDSVLDFCSRELPVFYTIKALSEYLNFEIKVLRFFESPDQGGPASQAAATGAAYAQRFARLAEESARALEASFTATDEIADLWQGKPVAGTITECRAIIRADFESLFTASRERLKRF